MASFYHEQQLAVFEEWVGCSVCALQLSPVAMQRGTKLQLFLHCAITFLTLGLSQDLYFFSDILGMTFQKFH